MTNQIKVLHILYELRSSGAEIMVKNATPYWNEKGVAQHILATAEKLGEYSDTLMAEGISIHHLPFKNSVDFYSKLLRLIRTYQFDVVHIHTERTALTYALLARLAGVPIIIRTLHSTYLFEGVIRFNRSVRRWIMHRLNIIQVSVSTTVKQNEQKRFHNSTLLINNWYDDSRFYPPSKNERAIARQKLGVTNECKVIISVGNCAPVKNHESIIRALSIIKETESNLEYWHIGEEEPETMERKLVEDLGLNNIVKFLGRRDDIRRFLWAADVFVMPSFREGFGIAVLEAYATGIPIVLAKTPGLEQWASIFPDLYFSKPSAEDLATKMIQGLNENLCTKRDLTFLVNHYGTRVGAENYYNLFYSRIFKC